MECPKIRELLSDYMDGILNEEVKAKVEEHLLTCKGCKEELASLKALIEELGSLDSVDAPADFLENLHKRMETRSRFSRIMRKLFFPWRVKIPLELATAAAMAVLVIAIFRVQQPLQQITDVSKDSTQSGVAKGLEIRTLESTLEKETYKPKPALKADKAEHFRRQIIELALLLKKEAPTMDYAPSAAMETAPAPASRDKKPKMFIQSPSTARMKTAKPEEERAMASRIGGMAEFEGDADLWFSSFDEILSKVKNLVAHAEGKVVSIEYDKLTERPQSIHAEIPAKDYSFFCKKLQLLGDFETPPPTLSEDDHETISIRIRFISS
ncbi:MAG: zf-HC2 domain-containing protein [Deltaproteobacteria bacterium]|nr:zf-HC2 domain-containing protein [Deltaproteobacteria bacterium]